MFYSLLFEWVQKKKKRKEKESIIKGPQHPAQNLSQSISRQARQSQPLHTARRSSRMPTGGHLCFTVIQELPGRCSLGLNSAALSDVAIPTPLSPQSCVTHLCGSFKAALTFQVLRAVNSRRCCKKQTTKKSHCKLPQLPTNKVCLQEPQGKLQNNLIKKLSCFDG